MEPMVLYLAAIGIVSLKVIEALYRMGDRRVISGDSGWKYHITFDGRTIVNVEALLQRLDYPAYEEFWRRIQSAQKKRGGQR